MVSTTMRPIHVWDVKAIQELMASTYGVFSGGYVAILHPLRAAKMHYTSPGKLDRVTRRAWRRAALRSVRRCTRRNDAERGR